VYKALAVAKSEFLNGVLSKAFIVGVVLMPVLMLGMIFVQKMAEDTVDITTRRS
jgi:ABC-type Na+ efflux pump permease subunit